MAKIRYFLPLLLVLPLAGCFSDQKAQLTACESGAPRTGAGEPFRTIQGCMDKAGYRFIASVERLVPPESAILEIEETTSVQVEFEELLVAPPSLSPARWFNRQPARWVAVAGLLVVVSETAAGKPSASLTVSVSAAPASWAGTSTALRAVSISLRTELSSSRAESVTCDCNFFSSSSWISRLMSDLTS